MILSLITSTSGLAQPKLALLLPLHHVAFCVCAGWSEPAMRDAQPGRECAYCCHPSLIVPCRP